jgi:DNA-directed RNA polymerase subunit N (RpoN/RPB10)
VQADLRCMMCGRVTGQLVGRLPPVTTASVASGKPPRFAVFRPADSAAPTLHLIGGEQFRCTTCGGNVIMDQLEAFSTYVEVVEEVEARRRRGRPAKPWRRTVVSPAWMLELGIAG